MTSDYKKGEITKFGYRSRRHLLKGKRTKTWNPRISLFSVHVPFLAQFRRMLLIVFFLIIVGLVKLELVLHIIRILTSSLTNHSSLPETLSNENVKCTVCLETWTSFKSNKLLLLMLELVSKHRPIRCFGLICL